MAISGPYRVLAMLINDAHGGLKGIRLEAKPKQFALLFNDGSEVSRYQSDTWLGSHGELFSKRNWAPPYEALINLAFGYSGTGSTNLSSLLHACGFIDCALITSEQDLPVSLPVTLLADGSLLDENGSPIDLRLAREKQRAERLAEEERRREQGEADEARRKAIVQRRRELKQCVFCGQPLRFFDKLLGRESHRPCVSFRE